MIEVFSSPAAFITMTCVVYAAAMGLYRKWKVIFFHPLLVSIAVIILILKTTDVSYEEYSRGGVFITWLLAPAVVALGIPLYREFGRIREQAGAVILTTVFGSLVGIISAVVPAILLGSPLEVVVCLAPKSVTVPIAMEIAARLGGPPPLAATIVFLTGFMGAIIGPAFLGLLGVVEKAAFGLAMGFTAHGIGTALAFERGETEGAFSSLGLCLNGIATAVFTPLVLRLCM